MAELQEWLKQNMHKYRFIKDTVEGAPEGDYEVEFVSVPLGDIPNEIICNIKSLKENKK